MILNAFKMRNSTGVTGCTGCNLTAIRVCKTPGPAFDRSNWMQTGCNWMYYSCFTPVIILYLQGYIQLLLF